MEAWSRRSLRVADGAGSRSEPLQENRDHGRLCAAAVARRSDAHLEPRAALAREWDLDRLARRLDELAGSGTRSVAARPASTPAIRKRASRQVLKIATFNINNVNRRLSNLLGWLSGSKPAVVCLQELKSPDKAFPMETIRGAGYEAIGAASEPITAWQSSRTSASRSVQRLAAGRCDDTQSRYIEAAVKGVLIASSTCPTGTRSRARNSSTSWRGSSASSTMRGPLCSGCTCRAGRRFQCRADR